MWNALEQFKVEQIIGIELSPTLFLGGIRLSLTNLNVYIVISLVLIEIIRRLIGGGPRVIGTNHTIIKGSINDTTHKIVKDSEIEEIYHPLIYLIFITILAWNLIGMIPYNFSISSNLIITLSVSVSILIGVTLIGLLRHKIEFFSLLVPSGTPIALVPLLVIIETISYLARAISLGVRLGANNLAGHVLIKILAGFLFQLMKASWLGIIIGVIPMAIFSLLIGLELGIAVLQAIVFILLTSSYLRDAISLH